MQWAEAEGAILALEMVGVVLAALFGPFDAPSDLVSDLLAEVLRP
jgi:hypothetical protein